jgi:hypothetical protein
MATPAPLPPLNTPIIFYSASLGNGMMVCGISAEHWSLLRNGMQISIFCDNFSSRHFCDIFVAMWSVKVIKIEKCICFKSGFHFKSNKTERLIRMHIKDYSINLSIMSSIYYYEFKDKTQEKCIISQSRTWHDIYNEMKTRLERLLGDIMDTKIRRHRY